MAREATRPALFAAAVLIAMAGCGSATRLTTAKRVARANAGATAKGYWVVRDLGAVETFLSGDGSIGWDFGIAINDRGQVVGTNERGSHKRAFLWDGRLRDLGTLPGDTESSAAGINTWGQVIGGLNDHGQVVGVSWKRGSDDRKRAFLWERGRMRDLGLLRGGDASTAAGINQHGQVAVSVATRDPSAGDDPYRAAIWDRGRLESLDATMPDSESVAINDRGQIVGDYNDGNNGFVWRPGKLLDLGGVPGGSGLQPTDINNDGQIVGQWLGHDGGYAGPFLWQHGSIRKIPLPPLWEPVAINDRGEIALDYDGEWILWQGGRILARGNGDPTGLNDSGMISISYDNSDGTAVPEVWSNGKTTRLPLLYGDEGGAALALNAAGDEVVGLSGTLGGWTGYQNGDGYVWRFHLVLWTRTERGR